MVMMATQAHRAQPTEVKISVDLVQSRRTLLRLVSKKYICKKVSVFLISFLYFIEVNLNLNDSKEYTAVIHQNKPFGHQVYHANKSDMGEELQPQEDFMAAEM